MAEKKEKSTALALVSEIDFSKLQKTIEGLGKSDKLTDGQRETGVQVLNDWETNVLDKLSVREGEITMLVNFIRNKQDSYYHDSAGFDVMKEKLTEISGTQKLYDAYVEAQMVVMDKKAETPERPVSDITITIEDKEKAYGTYRIEMQLHDLAVRKLETAAERAKRAWERAVRGHSEIKKLLGDLEGMLGKLKEHKATATDLAMLAKMNLAISDEDTRTALREILSFCSTMK